MAMPGLGGAVVWYLLGEGESLIVNLESLRLCRIGLPLSNHRVELIELKDAIAIIVSLEKDRLERALAL